MTHGTKYVPILRWKRAESVALQKLSKGVCNEIIPFIELVPKAFADCSTAGKPSADAVLNMTAEEILQTWGQDPFFLDTGLLNPSLRCAGERQPLEVISREADARQLELVPVTALTRYPDYQSAVAKISSTHNNGICVRLLRDDIGRGSVGNELMTLLSRFGLKPHQVDLMIDYQFVESLTTPDFASLSRNVPFLEDWRTLIVASGAFPKDLAKFTVGQHLHPRLDWHTWIEQSTATQALPRTPVFADYTIQHPLFSEPPSRSNFSASIRYTAEHDWVIMRGEGVRNDGGPGYTQWPANAQLLCERAEFCGREFSYGDAYIWEIGEQSENTGNAETWLRAGINHHMTFVVKQIASLSAGAVALAL